MRIKDVCKMTGLTDKAIRVYINNQLIFPSFTENYNGRKNYDFSVNDVETLKNIALLRKYNFSIADIKKLLDDNDNIDAVLKSQITCVKSNAAETSFVLANLNNAYENNPSNINELCNLLSENIEPTEYNFIKSLENLWLKLKKRLPVIISTVMFLLLIATVLIVITTILISHFLSNQTAYLNLLLMGMCL